MVPRLVCITFFSLGFTSVSDAGTVCGAEIPCAVGGGEYRIELPANGDVRGAYVYFHGFKGSAESQMRQRSLVDTTLAHHLAFVAVDGLRGSWSFLKEISPERDEKAFVTNVLNDLHQRYGIGPQKTVIGGFSIGASMAWYTTCAQGDKVAATVTFSGVFWNPLPKATDCVANLPPLIHFHGTADRTFPLAGRAIGERSHQGDAFKSLSILRERARCDLKAAKPVTMAGIKCDDVPDCVRGDSIACIHNGGHEARADMLDEALTAVGFPR
jgi:polyhydroxybutyrate depolymerase